MTFDSGERRLITAAHDGTVKMWNYNTGACLKTFVNPHRVELSALVYIDVVRRSLFPWIRLFVLILSAVSIRRRTERSW